MKGTEEKLDRGRVLTDLVENLGGEVLNEENHGLSVDRDRERGDEALKLAPSFLLSPSVTDAVEVTVVVNKGALRRERTLMVP